MDVAWELSLILDGTAARRRICQVQPLPGTSSLLKSSSKGPHTYDAHRLPISSRACSSIGPSVKSLSR